MEAYIFFFILSVIAIIVIFLLPKSPKTLFLQGDENFFLTEVIKKIKKSKPKEKLDHYVKKILENILQEKIEGSVSFSLNPDGNKNINLRELLGIPGFIKIEKKQNKNTKTTEIPEEYLFLFDHIAENNLAGTLVKNTLEILENRWKLLENIPEVIKENNDISYLYLKRKLPGIISYTENDKERYNLLCSEEEFQELLRRIRT